MPIDTRIDFIPIPFDEPTVEQYGRSFTRLTKEVCKFEAPFDERFNKMMVETVKGLVADTGMGIVYGYTQSDEISLLFAPESNVFGRSRNISACYRGRANTS